MVAGNVKFEAKDKLNSIRSIESVIECFARQLIVARRALIDVLRHLWYQAFAMTARAHRVGGKVNGSHPNAFVWCSVYAFARIIDLIELHMSLIQACCKA